LYPHVPLSDNEIDDGENEFIYLQTEGVNNWLSVMLFVCEVNAYASLYCNECLRVSYAFAIKYSYQIRKNNFLELHKHTLCLHMKQYRKIRHNEDKLLLDPGLDG